MRRKIHSVLLHALKTVLLGSLVLVAPSSAVAQTPVRLTVHDRALNEVDPRLFGHFLERPSWDGETGPEAAVDPATGALASDVVRLMETLDIPIVRFPGGLDVDYMNWTDMIDNAPGRSAGEGRPTSIGYHGDSVTNAFGYDEALRLADELGAEVILTVNLGDAVLNKKTTAEAARHAAALVAYCNAEVGADLPDFLEHDWPAIRAENGHPEPYDVRYFEIGNEIWLFRDADGELLYPRDDEIPASVRDRYFQVVRAYIDAMRAVDPDIDLIVDGDAQDLTRSAREELGDRVQYLAYHTYYPWGISEVTRDGEPVPPEQLEPSPTLAAWYGWASPRQTGREGLATLATDDHYQTIVEEGYPVAVTEWNWNGWWEGEATQGLLASKMARALGAAGYLHAFMRSGDHAKLALQSTLVGQAWGITGIRYDPETRQSRRFPTGRMTGFYARHHGDQRIALTHEQLSTYEQPYQMNQLSPQTVAYLDPVATRRGDTVYVHLINRHFSEAKALIIDASPYGEVEPVAKHFVMGGDPRNRRHETPNPVGTREIAHVDASEVRFDGQELRVEVPPHAVSTFVFVAPQTGASMGPQ